MQQIEEYSSHESEQTSRRSLMTRKLVDNSNMRKANRW